MLRRELPHPDSKRTDHYLHLPPSSVAMLHSRRKRWIAAALGLVMVLGALRTSRSHPAYNVLLITLDTTRADHIGCYGHVNAQTPTLDALAADGVVFENAYCTVPMTLPSHASILTGLYPPETGMHLNGRGRLDPELPHWAATLQGAGYRTGAFIASVVLYAKHGLNHGFDHYDDDMAGGVQHGHEEHLMRNADLVVDRALAWLGAQQSDPFFCWVHLFDPHAPYEGHAEVFGERFRDRPYDGDIAFADLHIGRLIDDLKARGLYDRTLIVVVGDHGEGLGEHLEEEHGFMLYNSTLHVPLIVSCPTLCQTGHRVATPVSQVDLLPTVLESLHVDVPEGVSGISLRPALRGSPLPPRACYSETESVYDAFGWAPLTCVVDDAWKYVQTTREELYNLHDDPQELVNLAESEPAQRESMRQRLAELQNEMVEGRAGEATLDESDRQKLASLGYFAGGGAPVVNEGAPLPDVKDMMPYYNREIAARSLIKEGKADEAIARLREDVAAVPHFVPAWMTLGAALQQRGQAEQAVEVFEAAAIANPSSAAPHFELGKHYAAVGETATAIEQYERVLSLDPHESIAHFNLGTLLYAEGKVDEARRHYEQGLAEFPDSIVGQFNFEHAAGQHRQARTCLASRAAGGRTQSGESAGAVSLRKSAGFDGQLPRCRLTIRADAADRSELSAGGGVPRTGPEGSLVSSVVSAFTSPSTQRARSPHEHLEEAAYRRDHHSAARIRRSRRTVAGVASEGRSAATCAWSPPAVRRRQRSACPAGCGRSRGRTFTRFSMKSFSPSWS